MHVGCSSGPMTRPAKRAPSERLEVLETDLAPGAFELLTSLEGLAAGPGDDEFEDGSADEEFSDEGDEFEDADDDEFSEEDDLEGESDFDEDDDADEDFEDADDDDLDEGEDEFQ